ncbi:cytochrome P450 [Auricularia subglabra TFB-10046 SS5]|nr:cytochrome P450 [Auricularia subglabra TFB-10046 SS5]
MATLQPIPEPRGAVPLLGHIFAIDGKTPVNSFLQWGRELGGIYKVNFIGKTMVVLNAQRLAAEACDERRFHKSIVGGPVDDLRILLGDALFTAYHGEENWGVAHRILVPAFGPASILGMFDDMYDILSQLVLKWERFGPKHAIDPSDDFTRLAFDTIAFCSMSHRLNSFYTEGVPPFVQAMGDFLVETDRRGRRPGIVNRFMTATNEKYEADMNMMNDLAREIIEERRANPVEKKDLLNAMLNGRDPQTGLQLTDKSIMEQMITFLVAGHETTSGMLSFFMYEVLKHPEVYAKLRAEIDTVVGAERIRPEHLGKLPYVNAVLREVLRLSSPINGFGVCPIEDEIIGGKYFLPKGQLVSVFVTNIHRDREVYGEDAGLFRPERMMDGKFEALPPKSWMPFGNGARACIGRAFAWQEAQMAIVTIFQKFDFKLVDPSYTMDIKQTLTIKPQGMRIYAIPRTDSTFAINLAPTLSAPTKPNVGSSQKSQRKTGDTPEASQPLYFLYGSNTGSCEMFAQRIANEASDHGFRAIIGTLDSATQRLATDGAVIIITASFEGEPPDNAVKFVKDLKSLSRETAPLSGVRYAVFGCGNHDWVHTFQRIPKIVDSVMEAHGAERLLERGEADAGGAQFFESFDEWEGRLWDKLAEVRDRVARADDRSIERIVDVQHSTLRASQLRQADAQLGLVTKNKLLTKPGSIDKHHLEIELPKGMGYRAGDYLAVLPTNPTSSVKRVLARFNLTNEQAVRLAAGNVTAYLMLLQVTISSSSPTTLPTNHPVNVNEVFGGYVELGQPATRKNIEQLLQHAPKQGGAHSALQSLLEHYVSEVLEKRLSVLSILESHPDIDLPLAAFLGMLPAMRVRQYSISSSPLWDPTRLTLTLGVLRTAALSDSRELFQGVASTFLAALQPGDRVQVAVRASSAAFHLPPSPETPIVMFASGSGIAPMRGFIQERAAHKAAGRKVGRALMFFGCRSPNIDFLYADNELKEWVEQGVVDVRPAFSRAQELSEGCRYVQERVWHDRADVVAAFESNAKVYTCGSGRVALGIKETCMRIVRECHLRPSEKGEPKTTPEEFWASIQNERYAADIFG